MFQHLCRAVTTEVLGHLFINKIMKHFVLILIVLFQMSCATQNSSTKEENSMKSLIKNKKSVFVENMTFDEEVDFTSILESQLISEGIYQTQINSSITFKKCIFNKPVIAFGNTQNGNIVVTSFESNVTFIDCIFQEEVNFRGSSIHGRADFTGSDFNANANFEEINCHENAYFNTTVFEGALRFQNAVFAQRANFLGAEFNDTVSFQNSLFNSEFQCSTSKFFKYADFTLIDCRGKVFFNYAEFKDKADFSHAIFMQDFDFVNTKNNTTNFNNARFFGIARFNKTEVISSLSLKESYFLMGAPVIDVTSEKLMYSK